MNISKEELMRSANQVGISPFSAEALWESLTKQHSAVSNFTQIIYYFGAFVVIGAMSWFFMQGWEWFGGGGILLISVLYGLLFTFLGNFLWKKHNLKIPAGLFYTLAVCMVPLAIFGIEFYTGFWMPHGEGFAPSKLSYDANLLLMEIGTVVASLIALWFVPFPFLTAPLSVALWSMSLTITSVLFGNEMSSTQLRWISLGFGLAMILGSYLIDCRTKEDYSFWGYLFGLIAFWFSLTWLFDSELNWFWFFIINLGLMLVSVLIQRRVFLVFGTAGVFLYFSHLAYEVFKDSMWFPFALSLFGLGLIYLGILYQRHEKGLRLFVERILPESWRNALPQYRKR